MSPKVSPGRINKYLDLLIDPSFQEVNKFFVIWFENEAQGILLTKSYKRYYLLTVETVEIKKL